MAVTITNDAATTRTNLGLGDAATKTVGTASGNIPVLDSSGKLASGRMPTFKTVGGSSIVGSGDISTLPSGGTADQVLTSDASSNATWADAAAGGKVLQVVYSNPTQTGSQDIGGGWTAITGMAVTITPIATTSRLYYYFSCGSHIHGNQDAGIQLLRNSTQIKYSPRWGGYYSAGGNWHPYPIVVSGVDLPGIPGAITYTVRANRSGGSYFRIHDAPGAVNNISCMVMEIGV